MIIYKRKNKEETCRDIVSVCHMVTWEKDENVGCIQSMLSQGPGSLGKVTERGILHSEGFAFPTAVSKFPLECYTYNQVKKITQNTYP